MNSTYKVVFNKVRGALMVVNELSSSVTRGGGKGTKLVAVAAAATLLAGGSAMAAPVEPELVLDWDSITTKVEGTYDQPTFKFHSGKGQVTQINTNASASKLVGDLIAAGKDPKKVLAALGQVNAANKTGVLTGFAGGYNYYDKSVESALKLAILVGALDQDYKPISDAASKVIQQFDKLTEMTKTNNGDTHVIIGGDGKGSPVLVGSVGADRVVNANLEIKFGDNPYDEADGSLPNLTVSRVGDSLVEVKSGNVFGHVNASSAINVGAIGSAEATKDMGILGTITVSAAPGAESTTTILDGNSYLTIEGTGCVGGAFAGGSAIALGGKADSQVTGNTQIIVNNSGENDGNGINALSVGLVGGGFAASFFGGESTSTVGGTTLIDVQKGVVIGAVGGGVAATGDAALGSIDVHPSVDVTINSSKAGTSTATSKAVQLNLGKDSATAGMIGGGIAMADGFGQADGNIASAKASVDTVVMNFEGPQALDPADKTQLHGSVVKVKSILRALQSGTTADKQAALEDLKTVAKDVSVPGAHVGNIGGGISLTRGYFGGFQGEYDSNRVESTSTVGTVAMNINGGYNVGTLGGGLAVGTDVGGHSPENQNVAASRVDNVVMLVNGGENVLVSAGGLAYATNSSGGGINSNVMAKAAVGTAEVLVGGGTVDGLFGGGIAIDDTAAGKTNAEATTEKVVLTVSGGEVNSANMDPITGIAHGVTSGAPSNGSYVYQTAKLVEHADAAVLGGGMATGGGALASVKDVSIQLTGGVVNGNVVAGGAATLGGESKVDSAAVLVAGSEVNGDIYGGGIAGSPDNDSFDSSYQGAASTVGKTAITLASGELNGNVYLGGLVYEGNSAEVSSKVVEGSVVLGRDFVFNGSEINGSGADKSAFTAVGGCEFKSEGSSAAPVRLVGFDRLESDAAVTGAVYDFAGKDAAVEGFFEFEGLEHASGRTLTLEGGALVAKAGFAGATFDVDAGLIGFGSEATLEGAQHELSRYPIGASLYIAGEADLTGSTILVGTTEADAGAVIGTDASLIVKSGSNVTGAVAGEGESSLHFVNVADGGSVHLDTNIEDITVDNVIFEVKEDADNNYSFVLVNDEGRLTDLGLDGFDLDSLLKISRQDDQASEFIESFLDQTNSRITSGDQRNAQLNAALNLAAAGGVQTAGIEGAAIGIDQVNKRASLTNRFVDGWTGFAEASGSRLEMGGDRGALETKTTLGGVAVGGEYTSGDMTFGVLGSFGTGDVKGQGDNSGVKNDVDYYGVQAYAAKRIGQFNVVGQMGYLMTDNDLTHDIAHSASVDADVFTFGARGEMRLAINDKWSAVPYVGLNWMRVGTDGYTTSRGIVVESTDQDLISMPIGVAVTGECANVGGWTMKPTVEVAYVHTFGDTDLDAVTRVGATPTGTSLDVWSENVGRLCIGLEARRDNMAFGINLGGSVGDNDHEEFYGQISAKYVF